MAKLETLNLAGTKVTDVSSLKSLTNLKELRLGKLQVAGLAELKKSLPKLVVVSK
jgi:Leucine-rich repeat (LRR) protein